MDLLNLQPHKINVEETLNTMSFAIMGNPKAGKTTFVHELYKEKVLFIATEKGYGAINNLMKLDFTNYSQWAKIFKQLKDEKVKEKFDCICVDSIDLFVNCIERYICNREGVQNLSDIPWGKGAKFLEDELLRVITSVQSLGYATAFISHTKVKMEKVPQGQEIAKYIPSLTERYWNVVAKYSDSILFAHNTISQDGSTERVLYLRETPYFVAGTRFKHMPSKLQLNANTFKTELIKAIEIQMQENPNGFTTEKTIAKEEKLNFEDLKTEVVDLVQNKFIPNNILLEATSIIEKHLGMGRKISEIIPSQVEVLPFIIEDLKEKINELQI